MATVDEVDIEKKGGEIRTTPDDSIDRDGNAAPSETKPDGQRDWKSKFKGFKMSDLWKFEARGILRVRDDEKNTIRPVHDFIHMFSLWFSINGVWLSLAGELGRVDYTGSADDNVWLHRRVMNELGANGGQVPAEFRD